MQNISKIDNDTLNSALGNSEENSEKEKEENTNWKYKGIVNLSNIHERERDKDRVS